MGKKVRAGKSANATVNTRGYQNCQSCHGGMLDQSSSAKGLPDRVRAGRESASVNVWISHGIMCC